MLNKKQNLALKVNSNEVIKEKNMYKIKLISVLLIIGVLSFIISCTAKKVVKTPKSELYGKIDDILLDDGYPKERQPWIILSDNNTNKIAAKPNIESFNYPIGELDFLSPLIVLKKQSDFVKVAEYKPDLIKNNKLPNKKKLNIYGWIPMNRTLLWNTALKETSTMFFNKAAVVINNEAVMYKPERYIDKDSVLVFESSDLEKSINKIPLGNIVYIYKQSIDKQKFLIGNKPSFTTDDAQKSIYGWVSKHVVSLYGYKTALKVQFPSDDIVINIKDSLSKEKLDYNNRIGLENIYPVPLFTVEDKNINTKFFVNPFDYSKNKIFNVLGKEIYYDRYKEILANNKKLNIVFVVDYSRNNSLYIPTIKSMLQELQLNMKQLSYFTSLKFGGVVYKNNTCRTSNLSIELTSDFREVADFFEKKGLNMNCADGGIDQPIDRGIYAASKLLNKKEDETNLIVVIGTTANQDTQSSLVTNSLTRSRAKLIFFQTQSKSSDYYNDFVLLAQQSVISSARNLVEFKKEKIITQENLLLRNSFNLTENLSGIFSLDYPEKSMTQGFVIFPKKGEVMPISILKSTVDIMLGQMVDDNKNIDSTLTTYFKSEIGLGNTIVAKKYQDILQLKKNIIPADIAVNLLGANNSFLLKGNVDSQSSIEHSKGVLLNEFEYNQLINFYNSVYNETITDKEFNYIKALNKYADIIYKRNQVRDITSKNMIYKNMTLSQVTAYQTGYFLDNSDFMGCTLKQLKKIVTQKQIWDYFESYKTLSEKLEERKSDPSLKIEHRGQFFYWLNEDDIPKLQSIKEENKKQNVNKGKSNFS